MQFTTIVDIVISSRHLIPLDVCHKKTHSSPSISFPFSFSPCLFIFFVIFFYKIVSNWKLFSILSSFNFSYLKFNPYFFIFIFRWFINLIFLLFQSPSFFFYHVWFLFFLLLFFCLDKFFRLIFFLILSFNIKLIENWTS